MKVEASSGLSSDEIDSMVEDAEKMSEKDKEKASRFRRETSLTSLSTGPTRVSRNLAMASPKMRKRSLSRLLRRGRKPLSRMIWAKLTSATEKITAVSHKLAELMYKKQQEEASAQGTGEGGQESSASEQGNSTSGDDVIDAEFTEQK